LTAYALRRLLYVLPVMLIVATIVFFIIHMTPGDPTIMILGEDATQEQLLQLRSELGLDRPLPVQYLSWLGRLVKGDMGSSLFHKVPVRQAIADRLEPTVLLSAMALCFSIGCGVPLGTMAAVYHNKLLDHVAMGVALLGVAMPNFWLGLNLILLFALVLGVFPISGYVAVLEAPGFWPTLRTLILPGFTLGFSSAASIARMSRANLLEVLRQDYVRTARAKGLSERRVIYKHALRNAFIPTITVIGFSVAGLMGGAVVTEQVFNIPGIGMLLIYSVARRDYPALQGVVLFIAFVYVIINLIVDLTYAVIDPRIRYS